MHCAVVTAEARRKALPVLLCVLLCELALWLIETSHGVGWGGVTERKWQTRETRKGSGAVVDEDGPTSCGERERSDT